MRSISYIIVFLLVGCAPSFGGGLLGDGLKAIGLGGVGKALDDTHRDIKNSVPAYKKLEEGTSAGVRHIISEAQVESLWPILNGMILASRQQAINDGLDSMPEDFKQHFRGFFDDATLNSVRYRIGGGGDLSLQHNSFTYGDAIAITLIDTIVFIDIDRANDLALWAHELQHVKQFRDWGHIDFAKRYIRDHQSVEQQAKDAATRYVDWQERRMQTSGLPQGVPNQMPQSAPSQYQGYPTGYYQQQVQQIPNSNICFVPNAGACMLGMYAPAGTPCWCASGFGPLQGFVSQ